MTLRNMNYSLNREKHQSFYQRIVSDDGAQLITAAFAK